MPETLIALAVAVLLAAIGSPVVAVWRWRGMWRWLAWLPVVVLAMMAARFAFDVAQDPTADNLWPLTLMLWALATLPFLGVVWLARRPTA